MLTSEQAAPVSASMDTAYVARGGVAGTIPWEQIWAILGPILAGCIPHPTPAKIKEAVANDRAREPAVRLAMIELYGLGGYRRYNGQAVSGALKEVVPTLPDDVLVAAID